MTLQRVVLVVLLTTNTSFLVETLYHNADAAYNSLLWVGRMPDGGAALSFRGCVLPRHPAGGWGIKKRAHF